MLIGHKLSHSNLSVEVFFHESCSPRPPFWAPSPFSCHATGGSFAWWGKLLACSSDTQIPVTRREIYQPSLTVAKYIRDSDLRRHYCNMIGAKTVDNALILH
jgi:hypothetical protein